MTNTTRPRFTATGGTINCNGVNHSDSGKIGTCLGCGADVARTPKGVFDIKTRVPDSGRAYTTIMCYRPAHTCDIVLANRFQAEQAAALAAGEITYDQRVIVIRGRKVAQGTIGNVFWLGRDVDYNGNGFVKVGIRTDAGDTFFIRVDYLRAHLIVSVNDCLDALAGVGMPTPGCDDFHTPRRAGSHADCAHEATKSARAACRKARA